MIIYGKQPILYAIETCPWSITEFYLAKELPRELFSQLAKLDKPIKRVDNKKAQALSRGGNHQGILAQIIPPQALSLKELKEKDSLLVLCGISDVGNIGSIFRTAYALGVGGIVICLPSLSQKAIESIVRLSSGAFLNMPYGVFTQVFDVLNELKNADFTLIGADMQGQERIENPQKWALFLGSESVGLSARLKHKLDTMLSIKMEHHFDSLNVAVATGILIDRINYAGKH
ncbi:23S rRNA (guanosine(2251)-2'-O)-methyltransferase RlmB [Helicobacter magdeburgensis]|uniref:23S rRNA (Guanosine(2251)-2'-O)-methyltransferase RlmB n=1 Tax=Helicobacter magdeburgensis TaxID=471858 RepID=A0A4V6I1I3_9HELI|nr:23S rRNA (guanosine(2251)-2'-O)-methyltransferase RlmB [Helicobacter magdeburgensis]TLD92412.1 23S rRNA (guanosine(2251)-2'-O)-methyltransferase RlmB [Helicobacter magdeburgensis]